MRGRIVVGLDGSAGSSKALAWVVDHMVEEGTEVIAVHVVRPFGEFVLDVPGSGLDDWRQDFAWELENVWAKPLKDAGVRHRCLTVEGNPTTALADVADAQHADVIVVGAKGHGGFIERVFGGVTFRLPHLAHQPVLVAPAPVG